MYAKQQSLYFRKKRQFNYALDSNGIVEGIVYEKVITILLNSRLN